MGESAQSVFNPLGQSLFTEADPRKRSVGCCITSDNGGSFGIVASGFYDEQSPVGDFQDLESSEKPIQIVNGEEFPPVIFEQGFLWESSNRFVKCLFSAS